MLKILLILCWTIALGSALELRLLTPDPAAGDMVSWEIDGALSSWMSTNVDETPYLEITGIDHRMWKRHAYLSRNYIFQDGRYVVQGDAVLRIRHSPRLAGTLTWTLRAPDGHELLSGVNEVAPARGCIGPIQVSTASVHRLSFNDGTPFIPIGANVCWSTTPERMIGFRDYLDALSAAGGNHCRLWLASWCGQIVGNKIGEWRLDQAQIIDDVLTYARSRKIYVTLVLDNHTDFISGDGTPYGKDRLERALAFVDGHIPEMYRQRLGYIVARWGADDTVLAWELMNEIDLAIGNKKFITQWATNISEHLRALDQDKRLRTISWSGKDQQPVMSVPAIDIAQLHCYVEPEILHHDSKEVGDRDMIGRLISEAAWLNTLGKPWFIGESGYQNKNGQNVGNERDGDGLLLFQQAWAGFMLGGCGSAMNWWWDDYIQPQELWSCYTGLSKIIARLDWKDVTLKPMPPREGTIRILGWLGPQQALLWPVMTADTWYNAVVLRRPRPAIQTDTIIQLDQMAPQEAYIIHYLDMHTGEERLQRRARSDKQGQLPVAIMRGTCDITLWIEKR